MKTEAVVDELTLDDAAVCERCTEGLVVRSVRTRRMFSGPFWRLAWTHADPQSGTEGLNCWAPPALPIRATIRRSADFARRVEPGTEGGDRG